tara:strand:- start:4626 stop:5096 length:471 start_codon:yes stop_codon:yes gene_type:complete
MKSDFLVIEHNNILRILFLKCNTLIKLKEYSNKKNINEVLKKNITINKILDGKSNDIEIEDVILEKKYEVFAPNNKMVTIELDENRIVLDIESDKNKKNLNNEKEVLEAEANENCISGCNFCMNGCNLICIGVRYICSCFNFYISQLCSKIKKNFE